MPDAAGSFAYGANWLQLQACRASGVNTRPMAERTSTNAATSRQPIGSWSSQAELSRPTTGIASVLIAAAVAGNIVTTLLCAAKQKIRATVAAYNAVPR